MKTAPTQVSFASGELSPNLHDRIDLDAYFSGATFLENFVPLPHGPIMRRRGTRFIAKAKSPIVRLMPFKFNIAQSFVLEFGEKYVRFFYQGGVVLSPTGEVYEIASEFTQAELKDITFAQSGDFLYFAHPAHKPTRLARYANNDWRWEPITFVDSPAEWKADNWPSRVAFFEQRLYYAATLNEPQQIWASRIGLFNEFTLKNSEGEVLDDMGLSYVISADDVNGIQWLRATDVLIVGTSGAEYKISSSSSGATITPKSIRISMQTNYGSSSIRAVVLGANILFVPRSKTRIRGFEYTFYQDQYTANDLTIFADHILEGRVREIDVQTAPDTYAWIITETGELIGCTYEKPQKVLAWHRHTSMGKFISITVLPTQSEDEIWLAIQRGNNTCIELLDSSWRGTVDSESAFYVDSGLTYTGEPTKTITGLEHLNGQEVHILINGHTHPPVTVSSGKIELQVPGTVIHVGLPFESKVISTVPQAQDTVSTGRVRRVYSVNLALSKSLGFKYGVVYADGREREDTGHMGPTMIMDKAKELFTGHIDVVMDSSDAKTMRVFVKQDLPLPLTIRGLTYNMRVGD